MCSQNPYTHWSAHGHIILVVRGPMLQGLVLTETPVESTLAATETPTVTVRGTKKQPIVLNKFSPSN